jgi:hypothetical protein
VLRPNRPISEGPGGLYEGDRMLIIIGVLVIAALVGFLVMQRRKISG